jgi:hypothetical protein
MIVYGIRKKDIPVKRLYRDFEIFKESYYHFIDTEKTKVNSVNYMKLLDNGLLPDSKFLPLGKTICTFLGRMEPHLLQVK